MHWHIGTATEWGHLFLLNEFLSLTSLLLDLNHNFTVALIRFLSRGCQMAIARFLDCMCLAVRASGLWLRYAAKLDPFLSLDCAPTPTPSTLA